jgi:Type VI secretion system (T6SS), amidase effector protein 4
MSVERIQFSLMQSCYETYRTDARPCKNPSIDNQCAVRMSLALVRNGFSFDSFANQRRIHSGRASCQLGDEAHVVGANELHLYLVSQWDTGLRGAGGDIRTQIAGTPGIVYFNNCFHRGTDAEGTNTGDHIDLWNGTNYYNQILGIGAGGNARAGTDLFSRASYVRYFWLP